MKSLALIKLPGFLNTSFPHFQETPVKNIPVSLFKTVSRSIGKEIMQSTKF